MILKLTFDRATRFKLKHPLEALSVARRDNLHDADEIVVDLEDIYLGVSGVLRAMNNLVDDDGVGIEFQCEDVYKLRSMQQGLEEMFADFVFNVEMRAKPSH
jgi:hypothetical protein